MHWAAVSDLLMNESFSDFSPTARVRIWAAPIVLQAKDILHDFVADMPLLTRVASHVGLVFLIVLTIAASNIQLSDAKSDSDAVLAASADPADDSTSYPDAGVANNFLSRAPNPVTDVPKRVRREVEKYTVRSGDSVGSIAQNYEVSPDSILWANAKLEDNPDLLSVGQTLNIPPASGVLYQVQNGDSIPKIANQFKGNKNSSELARNILASEFNQQRHDLKSTDSPLNVGEFLIVPGGSKPYIPRVVTAYAGPIPASAAKGNGNFGWPVSGIITQKFWTRHPGIDVGAPTGTPVFAADSGYVVLSGWDKEPVSYGFEILINHGNNYLTRYAHLSAFNVEVGDSVKKGQIIGRVGATGNATGPHLHFEIIDHGVRRNPVIFLGGR
jgi:murein DD-endopeptidase MepM/ murein hydrolase activator NlpD